MAISRITPDIFDLHLVCSDTSQAGRPLRVIVRAAHPVTSRPVSGVAVQAQLALDENQQRVVSATRMTNARVPAVFKLPVLRDVVNGRSAGLKASGRRGGLAAEVSSDVYIWRFATPRYEGSVGGFGALRLLQPGGDGHGPAAGLRRYGIGTSWCQEERCYVRSPCPS
jgi:hypothetical protein